MTTELGNSDAPRAAERRGMSRRQMIKASAVAGAAAWTAPVIVDSLASPAAAGSNCNVYWVKVLGNSTTVSYNCPGSNTFDVCDAWWAEGNPTNPPSNFVTGGGCSNGKCGQTADANHGAHLPAKNELDGNYRKITLGANCTFDSATSWQIGGRYNASPSDTYLKITSACVANTPSGNGCYGTGASNNVAWVSTKNGTADISYVYLKFCCSTKP